MLADNILYVITFFLFLIGVEAYFDYRKLTKIYNFKETMANLSIMVVNQLIKPLRLAFLVLSFEWLYEFHLFTIPQNGWTVLIALVLIDFIYYWQHRFSHEWKSLWALHHVHHSSPWMNLSTAFRVHWLSGFFLWVFFAPVVLIGFHPDSVMLFFAANLFYQFFLHTKLIGKLGVLEGWINTPSAHRVHHGSNPLYIDKNHGGVLMVWDRIFGTYQSEIEEVKYGVTTGFYGHNPLKLMFLPMVEFFKGKDRAWIKPALILVLILTVVGVKRTLGQKLTGTPKERGQVQTEWMKQTLELTTHQFEEMRVVNEKYAGKVEAIVAEEGLSLVQLFGLAKEKEVEMELILSPRQMSLYHDRKLELKDIMLKKFSRP